MKRTLIFALLLLAFVPAAIAQNAVLDWNNIAVTTALKAPLTPNGTLTAPASNTAGGTGLYLAYVHLAMYDAVNAINGGYQPYAYSSAAPVGASADAAAIAAAFNMLAHFFPDQLVDLTNSYMQSISAITDVNARDLGVQVGQAAASALVAQRTGDGLGTSVPYSFPSAPVPGVWILTPGATAPQTPWVGQMRPFTMATASQFLPDEAPPALDSTQWADDYNQVKALGAVNSTVRTPEQTDIALFWTDQTARQYANAFRAWAAANNLDTAQSARLFAMLWSAYADSFIGCMNAKYHFSFWRPVTAIRNGDIDGNSATIGDPAWSPLRTTPNHPEYPAAHGCVTGAVAEVLAGYAGTPNVSLGVRSSVVGIANPVRNFRNVNEWQQEVLAARIYAGFHYHHSLVQGFVLGRKVAHNILINYFQPLNGR